MRIRLLWKILLLNVPVVATVVLIIWLAIDYLAADYFTNLMENYDISPTAIHRMFLDSVHRYLIGACLAAVAIASIVSFLLTKRVLKPLSEITDTIRAMGAGTHPLRVRVGSNDEIGDLAVAFNRMSENIGTLENLRRTMLIDVAHELRTPLTNIRGYLEALQDGVVQPEPKTFALIQREAMRLAALVEDVLELARADAARITLEKHDLKLAGLIREAVDRQARQFLARRLRVGLRIEPGIEWVRADREKLTSILTNLLQNARQYATPASKVSIAASASAGEIRISVRNTGSTIPAQDLPWIFERFYRGDKSRSRQRGGAGIGLAIVKQLVEAHGGRVGADSADGLTEIWFTLPR